SKLYNSAIRKISRLVGKGKVGARLCKLCREMKFALKDFFLSSSFFEKYGLRYFGPVDGHNIEQLENYLTLCKSTDYPVLLHVKTIKGKGNDSASEFPDKFHSISPLRSDSQMRMNHVLGQELLKLARADKRIIGVTAAMANGTGLAYLRDNLPNQYLDVGIAEEHAVTMCAGLAKAGMRPVCIIYSTFMQRAFDQLLHDICLQNLPVIFCIERAGLAANDGPTHHGLFDITYTRCLPNAVVMQPRNTAEFQAMIREAMNYKNPIFIRYNSAYNYSNNLPVAPLKHGCAETLKQGCDICLVALGKFIDSAIKVDEYLGGKCGIVNARFIKPLDRNLLLALAKEYSLIASLEDNVLAGGFGSALMEYYNECDINVPVLRFGWPDCFVEHGTNPEILQDTYHLDPKSIAERISAYKKSMAK
ncbi:MAG: 1-deoxy-D-xylulose-5-phosphate synthase, partial [Opitutales bacterium]|nr:1-deoxy-D-xylulose-5-phosphate synthase [Opitutales bacterium]